ncbi:MAG: GNAT family N-acetyltransferase [Candidatus Paceibacterota bacterium]
MNIKISRGLYTLRWEEYRDLKLEALRNEPLAFSPGIEAYESYTDEDWQEELDKGQTPPSMMLFAEEEDTEKLIGMIGIRFYELPRFQHNAGLQALYVTPEMRGQGVGKALVSEALNVIADNKQIENIVCEIVSSQEASLALHKELGFEVVGTLKKFISHEGEYYDNYFLQKRFSRHSPIR